MFDSKAQENLAIAIGVFVVVGFLFFSGLVSFNTSDGVALGIDSLSNIGGDVEPELGVERELFDGRVYVTDTVFGNGPSVEPGSIVTMHYIGGLLDGEIFDSSYDKGEPIQFLSGVGMVIPGIDGGIQGMQIGGQRTIVIAPEFGYGDQTVGPIPAGSTLVFQVEIVNVESGEANLEVDDEGEQIQ